MPGWLSGQHRLLRVRSVHRGKHPIRQGTASKSSRRHAVVGDDCTQLRPAAPRAFRCRSLPLAAAFFFATPVDQVTDIPRPYAHMQADELADEITVARECIATTRDLRLRKQMQAKLAELLAEDSRRFAQDLPF